MRDRVFARVAWYLEIIDQAASAVLTRPARSALTSVATVVGVAALVTTVGVAGSAGQRITDQIEASGVAYLTAQPVELGAAGGLVPTLPPDSSQLVRSIDGVAASSALTRLDDWGANARTLDVVDPIDSPTVSVTVIAASPEVVAAVHGSIGVGRAFDAGHDSRGDPVAIVGQRAAERLGVERVDNGPTVWLSPGPVTMIGVLVDSPTLREPSLLDSVIVPEGFARDHIGQLKPERVVVRPEPGWGDVVGRAVRVVLNPADPDLIDVRAVGTDPALGRAVVSEVNSLLVVLAAIALGLGGVAIAATMALSVAERRSEIGLRLALGATPGSITGQFLTEAMIIGIVGGICGASFGVVGLVVMAGSGSTEAILHPMIPILGVGVGAVSGLLAGTVPAMLAARLEPSTTLRSA